VVDRAPRCGLTHRSPLQLVGEGRPSVPIAGQTVNGLRPSPVR
jgi:hypothetical protein